MRLWSGWCWRPGARTLTSVVVQAASGRQMEVRAKQFVIAAGTVETCRLLLASGVGEGRVGVNLHDHLTLAVATFTGAAREAVLRDLRPWVCLGPRGATVHSVKLEAGAELRSRLGVNPAMAHVTFEEPANSGPALLRSALRARQEGKSAAESSLGMARIPAALLEALRFVWWARVRRRRYVSSRAEVRLQVNLAQDSPSTSRVLLSEDVDRFGLRRAIVDWRVSEGSWRSIREFAAWVRKTLAARGVDEGVVWEPAVLDGGGGEERMLALVDDARHAMGGACMGTDPRTSVVDPELRVHGISNLSVASAAVFPDGSPQLPTLTLAALCLRLADRLQKQLA